jgi:FAD/FMN-containing dehydrogenase
MADLQVTTLTGRNSTLKEASVTEFQKSLRGGLICPGDDSYDEARKVWNGMIDRRPGLIARCAGVSDVINSVNFARANNLLTAVRGGAHSFAGNAVCNGGIVIDLSWMKGIRVDPVRRTARAEGGVKWVEFDRETQAFGLATTGGTVSDTGIAGLTLGGGHGWIGSKHGLTCDNLISADIVTADGQFRVASATEHPDLLWGLRGGGGNFGVVTSFEYQLHPVGQMLAGMVVHPLEKAKEVLQFYHEFASRSPDEVSTMAFVFKTPAEEYPAVAIIACYNGPMEAAEEALRPVREFGPPWPTT